MQLIKKNPEIFGAVRFTGLNIKEIKDFVSNDALKIDMDKITQKYLVYINGKIINLRDTIVRTESGYEVYSEDELYKHFADYKPSEITFDDGMNYYIGVQVVKAVKKENKCIYKDSSGFQREMETEKFEKTFRPMTDYYPEEF